MKVDIIDAKTGVVRSVPRAHARILVKLKRARFTEAPQRAPRPVETHVKTEPVEYETRSVKSTETKAKRGRARTTD